jgi:hypothetical protein
MAQVVKQPSDICIAEKLKRQASLMIRKVAQPQTTRSPWMKKDGSSR